MHNFIIHLAFIFTLYLELSFSKHRYYANNTGLKAPFADSILREYSLPHSYYHQDYVTSHCIVIIMSLATAGFSLYH